LAPEVWRLSAGDTIPIHLINGLARGERAATNLHTHGRLVAPNLDTRDRKAIEPVGDTVYVCTLPEGTDPSSPADVADPHGRIKLPPGWCPGQAPC